MGCGSSKPGLPSTLEHASSIRAGEALPPKHGSMVSTTSTSVYWNLMIKTVNPDNNESDNAGGNAIQERSAFISAVKKHYDNHECATFYMCRISIGCIFVDLPAEYIKFQTFNLMLNFN